MPLLPIVAAFALLVPVSMSTVRTPDLAMPDVPDSPESATLLWAREQFITKGHVKLDPMILMSTSKEIRGYPRDSALSEKFGQYVHGVARLSDVRKCEVNEKGVNICRIDPLGGVVLLSKPVCETEHLCTLFTRLFGQSGKSANPISDRLYRLVLRKEPDMWGVEDARVMPFSK